MISLRKYGLAGIAGLLACATAQAQLGPQLKMQLDAAAKQFHNVQTNVQFDQFSNVAKEHDISTGPMYVERQGSNVTMGASYTEAGTTTPKILNYSSGVLKLYSPGQKQVDIFRAGPNQSKYEGFLALGFGASGTDLEKDWVIQDQGSEIINGVKTEKLDLVGKDPNLRKTFTHVTLWIDPVRGISLKRIFYQPDGDTATAVFSNIRVNTEKIDKKPYAIDPKAKQIVH